MEMGDQVIDLQLKTTMCAQEGLLLQLTYVNYETLDTILMIIKIVEKTHEEMVSRYLKSNVTMTTQNQMMVEMQTV